MVRIPNLENAWQIQNSCGFPSAEYVGFVVQLFYKKWKYEFGDKDRRVYKNLNTLMIEWSKERKWIEATVWSIKGKATKGYVSGMVLTPSYIWVWEERFQQLGATALVHELMHSAIWAQMGAHGDPDHEGGEFEGWTKRHTNFIREINTSLAQLGI
jgi:hypothetical protein